MGEARKTSQPMRAMSKRGVPVPIISMALQAWPMVTGHSERACARALSRSTAVSMKPGPSSEASACRRRSPRLEGMDRIFSR